MKYICFLWLLLFFAGELKAQSENAELARIKDKDGFTFLRKGPGKQYAVIDTIKKNEFFYCVPGDSAWYKVYDIYRNYTGGYIAKSRVQFLDKLSDSAMSRLIRSVFRQVKALDDELDSLVGKAGHQRDDSIQYGLVSGTMNQFMWNKYLPCLGLFEDYFERTKDTSLLEEYMNTMPGTSNETPSYVLGRCYMATPGFFYTMMKRMDDKGEVKGLLDMIGWGIENDLYPIERGDNRAMVIKYGNMLSRIALERKIDFEIDTAEMKEPVNSTQ